MDARQSLRDAGAREEDLDSLIAYLENQFTEVPEEAREDDEAYLSKWELLVREQEVLGAAESINRYVAGAHRIEFLEPERVSFEIYPSVAGRIPIILSENTADFEALVIALAYRGEPRSDIHKIGAMFLFGKTTRFIILSDKPYSNVPASEMDLREEEWRKKSYMIRREHECAHYYTKRYYGSSRNNLHDELIADFMGYSAAFGTFKASWFTRALGLTGGNTAEGRFQVYTSNLSESGTAFLKMLTFRLAETVEKWSGTEEVKSMPPAERIKRLSEKSLLTYL